MLAQFARFTGTISPRFCSAGTTSFVAFPVSLFLDLALRHNHCMTFHEHTHHDFPWLIRGAAHSSPPSQIRSLSHRRFAEGRAPSADIFGHPEQIEMYFLPLFFPSPKSNMSKYYIWNIFRVYILLYIVAIWCICSTVFVRRNERFSSLLVLLVLLCWEPATGTRIALCLQATFSIRPTEMMRDKEKRKKV